MIAAVCLSFGALGAASFGRARAGRTLLAGAATLSAAAVAVLALAMWRVDTTLVEVALATSHSTAAPLRLAGLWGGPAGSLLCFAALVAAVAAAAAMPARRLPTVGLVAVAAPTAALLCVAALARPFRLAALAPIDGGGLVPVLRRTSMLVHPPVVYAGLALLLVPAVVGIADLAGRADDGHRALARRIALVAWSLLALGMVLGSRWAHREVGWGGVWAWDPVEDAALLPWLAVTAGLHQRSARGWWAGAGLLALAGTWITRSGRLESVHAFSGQGAVGLWLGLALVASAAAVAVVAVAGRRRSAERDAPERQRRVSVALLVGAAAAWVGIGTAWAAAGGGDRTVAASFYVSLVGPLAVAGLVVLARGARPPDLVVAAAVGGVGAVALALVGWRSPGVLAVAVVAPAAVAGSLARASGHGARLAHLGFVAVVAGGVATTAGQAGTARLSVGEERSIAGLGVRLLGLEEVQRPDNHGVAARLEVSGRRMAPALVEVEDRGPRADVVTSSGVGREVQAALVSTDGNGTAVVSVSTTPGATWVWGGGLLLAGGGLAEAVARRPKRRAAIHQPQPALDHI